MLRVLLRNRLTLFVALIAAVAIFAFTVPALAESPPNFTGPDPTNATQTGGWYALKVQVGNRTVTAFIVTISVAPVDQGGANFLTNGNWTNGLKSDGSAQQIGAMTVKLTIGMDMDVAPRWQPDAFFAAQSGSGMVMANFTGGSPGKNQALSWTGGWLSATDATAAFQNIPAFTTSANPTNMVSLSGYGATAGPLTPLTVTSPAGTGLTFTYDSPTINTGQPVGLLLDG